ncbi:hypothetical protein [Actinoallomurus sp. NPDC052274]|uniref:hypothetical protein n=1 Tax=Actinoallomurus sp. NPDC052274 TaxID=3155420 RepID=UPI00342ACCA4
MKVISRAASAATYSRQDREVFDQLKPHLDRVGIGWIMLGPHAVARPMLLVNLPASHYGTHLYIDRLPLLCAPAVYGFSGIYLGMAHNPQRITARLAWLLRHGDHRHP